MLPCFGELLLAPLDTKHATARCDSAGSRLIEGIKRSETGDERAIRDTLTGEITRVRRAQVAQIKPTGSVMPEGLTAPLTRQQLADLVRYLLELGN